MYWYSWISEIIDDDHGSTIINISSKKITNKKPFLNPKKSAREWLLAPNLKSPLTAAIDRLYFDPVALSRDVS